MRNCLILIFYLNLFMPLIAYAKPIVIDGDSLEIDNRRIRLDGIDAPEFNQICDTFDGKTYECGKKAMQFAIDFIAENQIECKCLPYKDKYKRDLCECFVNGKSLNQALVAAGWALTYRDTTYQTAQNNAQNNKLGIWQGRFMRPALYRVLEKYTKNEKTE